MTIDQPSSTVWPILAALLTGAALGLAVLIAQAGPLDEDDGEDA